MQRYAPVFYGKIENGRLLMQDKEKFREHFSSLEGRLVSVVVKKATNDLLRSENENRYYWGVVVPILREWGGYSTKQETHEEIGKMFWGELKKRRGLDGKMREEVVPKSTASMSISEFEDHMQEIRDWATSEGIKIPLPNEVEIDN